MIRVANTGSGSATELVRRMGRIEGDDAGIA